MKSTSFSFFPFSPFIIILYVCTLICSQTAVVSSNNIVDQSCSQAANTDPDFSYEFCVAALQENPKSQNATSLKELVVISILQARSNSTRIASKISQLLTNPSLQEYTKDRLVDCLEVYSDAESDLSTAGRAFEDEDYETVNIRISAAIDAPGTCEDGFKEEEGEEVCPLSEEDSVFFQLAAVSLALLSLVSHSLK